MTTRLVFAGTPVFAAVQLQALLDAKQSPALEVVGVLAQPDKPAGRGRKIRPGPVCRLAAERALPLLQPARLDQSLLQEIRRWQPDLLVVAAYGRLLPPQLLAIPRKGCLNVHSSLLPRYRGAAPVARAILAGETQTGISFMLMDQGLDTGPVLSRHPLQIDANWNTAQLTHALAQLAAARLPTAIGQWTAGRLQPQPQDHRQAVPAPAVAKSEARLNWRQPARQIHLAIRAFTPAPGAWSLTGSGLRVKLLASLPPPEGSVGDTSLGLVGNTPPGSVGNTPSGPTGNTPLDSVGNTPLDSVGNTPPGSVGSMPSGLVGSMPSGLVGSMPSGLVGNMPPGSVVHPGKGRLAIVCGDGQMLEITRLQLAGKRPATASDVRNSSICAANGALGAGACLI